MGVGKDGKKNQSLFTKKDPSYLLVKVSSGGISVFVRTSEDSR